MISRRFRIFCALLMGISFYNCEYLAAQNQKCILSFDDTNSNIHISPYIPFIDNINASPEQILSKPGLWVSCIYIDENKDSIATTIAKYEYEFRRNGRVYFRGRIRGVTFDNIIREAISNAEEGDSLIAFNFDLRVKSGDQTKSISDKSVIIDTFKLRFNKKISTKNNEELKASKALWNNEVFKLMFNNYGSDICIECRIESEEISFNNTDKLFEKKYIIWVNNKVAYDLSFFMDRLWKIKWIRDNRLNKKISLSQWEKWMKSDLAE